MRRPLKGGVIPDAGAHSAHALDNIGDVDACADDVENQGCAVKEDVRLGRAEELGEKAEEAEEDDDVEQARDERGGLVDEAEVGLELVEVFGGDWV